MLGFCDVFSAGIDYLGIKSTIYINAGVALFNLEKMRKDNKTFELLNLTNSNVSLISVDQTALNFVLYPKIGRLPSKFCIFNFEDNSDLNFYLKLIRTKVPLEELKEAFNKPAIIHFQLCYPKPWFYNSLYKKEYTNCGQRHNCSCAKYFDLWHSIANNTDYYEEMKNLMDIK
jgi:lipopolysaccharide biosynthesis glycosyltransferase